MSTSIIAGICVLCHQPGTGCQICWFPVSFCARHLVEHMGAVHTESKTDASPETKVMTTMSAFPRHPTQCTHCMDTITTKCRTCGELKCVKHICRHQHAVRVDKLSRQDLRKFLNGGGMPPKRPTASHKVAPVSVSAHSGPQPAQPRVRPRDNSYLAQHSSHNKKPASLSSHSGAQSANGNELPRIIDASRPNYAPPCDPPLDDVNSRSDDSYYDTLRTIERLLEPVRPPPWKCTDCDVFVHTTQCPGCSDYTCGQHMHIH